MCGSVVEKVSHSSLTSSPLCICLLVCFFSTDVTDLEPARLRGKDLIRFMCPKGRSSKRLDGVYFCFGVYLILKNHITFLIQFKNKIRT